MMFPQATSHGNILTFTPPGFKQILNVKFPDSRLAVCEKCKKNFKTKDMCRVRNTHTAPPWTTAYVCVTIDESCTDEDGKFIDKPMTLRMVTWRPYSVRKPFHQKTPVCASCKRTNRTRSFCRERHKHRQLPWCTVYVLLSAYDQADPATVVAGASKPLDEGEEDSKSPSSTDPAAVAPENKEEETNGQGHDGTTGLNGGSKKTAPAPAADVASASSETISSDVDDQGDDINEIPESRTFLAKVNSRGSSIHWLDLADYDDTATPTYASPDGASAFSTPALTPPQMDPSAAQAHYYAHAQYAQQQHQNALQSHQQYFFQMQQRQHQQYAQWQQQYAQQMAQGGEGSAVTAGEAAAASQRRQGEGDAVSPTAAVTASPGQPSAAWPPMYYAAPTAGFYSPPGASTPGAAPATSQESGTNPPVAVIQDTHTYHHDAPAPLTHPGDTTEDQPDAKRHRTS